MIKRILAASFVAAAMLLVGARNANAQLQQTTEWCTLWQNGDSVEGCVYGIFLYDGTFVLDAGTGAHVATSTTRGFTWNQTASRWDYYYNATGTFITYYANLRFTDNSGGWPLCEWPRATGRGDGYIGGYDGAAPRRVPPDQPC